MLKPLKVMYCTSCSPSLWPGLWLCRYCQAMTAEAVKLNKKNNFNLILEASCNLSLQPGPLYGPFALRVWWERKKSPVEVMYKLYICEVKIFCFSLFVEYFLILIYFWAYQYIVKLFLKPVGCKCRKFFPKDFNKKI